jgi:ATP-binding protein involved in chromosome partitioning
MKSKRGSLMSNKADIGPEALRQAMAHCLDPESRRSLMDLGLIRGIEVQGDKVAFDLVLSPHMFARREMLRQAAESAARLPGIGQVDVRLKADVPADGRMRALAEAHVRNALAIASGKGGVGKTTVAVNIAVALAQAGASVGLLDADIYGPNVPTMMGVDHLPELQEGRIIPAQAFGVKVMSIGFMVPPGQPLIWRGPMLHSAIRQFINDVDWGELDYMIIDLPPGTGDAQLSLTQSMPLSGGLIITLPQRVSLEDARRGLEMFRTMDVSILGVVENMSYLELPDGSRMDIFGGGGGELLAREAGVPFLGSVPMDPEARQAGDDGTPIVFSRPTKPVAAALRRIAENLAITLADRAGSQDEVVPIQIVD